MKRALFAMMVAAASVVVVTPVNAQMAGALGKPLPSPDLPTGSVSVRIVAGTPSKPVVGTDVTLIVAGAPRVARTDAAGRAHFKDLPAGAEVQAKVVDEDKKEVASDPFPVPAQGGVRIMLTTLPWNPSALAAPATGAAGAQPNPRQMSGQPQPEQSVAPGKFSVRLSYDDFKDAPPVDVPVALVGYTADNKVTFVVRKTDAEGRATFEKLDRSGATSYFAMAQLARGTTAGSATTTIDRLISQPAVLDSRIGARLVLSGEKRTSGAPAVDDLVRLEKQDPAPPAGKVRVVLEGGPDVTGIVTLVDAETKLVLGRGKPAAGAPDPSEIQASAQFAERLDLPAGTLEVRVRGGAGKTNDPIAGVSVRIIPESAQDASLDFGAEHKTLDTGVATLIDKTPEPLTAVVTINGKPMRSKPFDLTKQGGVLEVEAHWATQGKLETVFELVPRAGQVVFAETVMHGQTYRSAPFQPVTDRGTRVTLFIFPRILFSFSLTSRIDDTYLGVNGRFEVSNNSWAPYTGGPDGVLISLPKGFVGGQVAEKDQGDVALAPTEGFRIVRPIAPGSKQFHGAFSLPIEDGSVTWKMDLPFGAYNSGMEILQIPGMLVQTPPGVKGDTMTVPQGTYFVLPNISILPKQSMVMSISGLPAPPAWRVWLPRIIGLFVVALILGGLGFALRKRGETDVAREARRQKLLDELVDLEKSSKNEKRREQLMTELEELWDEGDRKRPTG